jgi:hypothetical protein
MNQVTAWTNSILIPVMFTELWLDVLKVSSFCLNAAVFVVQLPEIVSAPAPSLLADSSKAAADKIANVKAQLARC